MVYTLLIDYVDYVFKKRSKKDQVICAIKTNIHIFISNTLFFMMIYPLIYSKVLGVFIKNNTSFNIVLDVFLTSVLLSSISVILGCIVHAIVLKAEGKPISDFASTGELEDKLLCTDFFICLSAISLRIYKLLYDFVSKFIPNTSKKKFSIFRTIMSHNVIFEVCMYVLV
ncbi:integral membrane protein [Ehrlichia ruminantium]|uniref:Integral membrane protein n=1 Tax=Ehrlichia ruminantium TaxID=779 RepID=A0A170SM01_EHRRU|nr:integral membrane protein [Ehrlichia ruminantium]